VLEYWFFYAYNNGPLNDHQGDWEMISVLLDLEGEPKFAAYSQHFMGEVAEWEDVEKTEGTHPNVYVAKGSHASYFRPYQGNFGFEGDRVGGDGERIDWNQLTVEILTVPRGDHPPNHQMWVLFAGRWGEYGSEENALRGEQGPLGPLHNSNGQKWEQPGTWARGLRHVDSSWFIVNWAVTNSLLLVAIVTALFAVVFSTNLAKRWNRGKLAIRNSRDSRMTLGLAIWFLGMILIAWGAILPWYHVAIEVMSGPYGTGGLVDVVTIDGVQGFTINVLGRSKGLTQLFGFMAPLGAFVIAGLLVGLIAFLSAETPRQMRRVGTLRGILALTPFVVILVFVSSLVSIIPTVAWVTGSNEAMNAILQVSSELGANPLGGTVVRDFGEYGNSRLVWELGLGFYPFVAGGAIMVAGAILVGRATPYTWPSTSRVTVETKFCIDCGESIPATSTFCGSCGARQPQEET